MNRKTTWLWLAIAGVLLAAIYLHDRFAPKPQIGPVKVMRGMTAAGVSSVQVLPRGKPPIQADRTNGIWRLTDPEYPARSLAIEGLLTTVEQLTAGPYISAQELKGYKNADDQFGFGSPQASLILGPGAHHLIIGNKTAHENQVFVQVVGQDGVYVVNAELLRYIPQIANDWRETALVDWSRLRFDRLIATNAGKVLELHADPSGPLWQMVLPLQIRADAGKVIGALQRLRGLHARQFVSDQPNADLEAFGLQSPDLTLAFFQGTNRVLQLEFGKSPTNNPAVVYARRADQNAIVTVSTDSFESWLASSSRAFRDLVDHHLVTLAAVPDQIEVIAHDHFTLQQEVNGTWRVLPQNYPADGALMEELITDLAGLQFKEIAKEIVLPPDLATYGLAPPARQYIFKGAAATNNVEGQTNVVLQQLDFGERDGQIFARRAGEDFVYAINPSDLEPLPYWSGQMRDRQIWKFTENDVARVTIRQNGKVRELLHPTTNSWTVAAHSTGQIQPFAIEEAAHQLGELVAVKWVARGDENRARYGFTADGHKVEFELRDGRKYNIEFGGIEPSGSPYAATVLDGETWIFQFSVIVYYKNVKLYLSLPDDGL